MYRKADRVSGACLEKIAAHAKVSPAQMAGPASLAALAPTANMHQPSFLSPGRSRVDWWSICQASRVGRAAQVGKVGAEVPADTAILPANPRSIADEAPGMANRVEKAAPRDRAGRAETRATAAF
jgi:hypothetical protein